MKRNIIFPVKNYKFEDLAAGDEVTISGSIYVARDAAHKNLVRAIEEGEKLPVQIEGGLIYYMGPSPAPEGQIIGSCGPTTSSRMDRYTLPLLELGLKATMGKGGRDSEVASACRKFGAIYLVTYGGCGAYLRKFVKKSEVIAYPELGPEAVYKLDVKDFPALVGIDIKGNNLYNK
ncbi:MAG TPA: FumA C-terminus/TtdB family hydratase beta subunit [bacterium]|nr:FumA C-terminus/TtdB family hydratase beta subunit [bacterium]